MKFFENTEIAFRSKSDYELKRAYLLFKSVNYNFLVNFGAVSLPIFKNIPGVKTLVKNTIFDHFCGGENLQESLQTVDRLYEQNVGSILDYSIEGKEDEKSYDACFNEILSIIDLAENNPKIPFVVFKPTGYGNIDLYEKVGKKQQLSPAEHTAWEHIKTRYYKTCKKAYEKGVKIMIDAEETWLQDAADDLAQEMMKTFNKERVVVLNTLQMYRTDRLEYLKNEFKKAEEEGYYLGFKIVRGAYMEKERERAQKMGYPSPIQPNKAATDASYNAAIDFITEHHDRIFLFAGTHNEESCMNLKNKIDQNSELKDCWFGQLLGMSDNISFVLGENGYHVAKYVPFGPVKEVIPYLIRRAQENTSVAGQSNRELTLIEKELQRRKELKQS
ncbi:proline dehydrogenase family protein [Ornithobacterium rhinotracheale]|uniref:proline dehydrogenase family protein n=1 Tax=Ornithobacterium rhinotracheale TaxID=28251 RepID=UPI003FA4A4F3